jgi:hypothetical protein
LELTTTTDDPIERMIWSLQPDNRAKYPQRFKMVLDFLGLTKVEDKDKESLRLGAIEFIKIVNRDPEWVEDKLMDFITYQYSRVEGGQIKPITIRNYTKAVKTFCVMNKISRFIEWTIISKGVPSGRASSDDRAPTAEELRQLIGNDLRMKVIVCIMSSCGIRVGAWNYLKVKHITPIKKGDVTLAWMKVYAGQNVGKRREYPTLITPEAYQAFQEYLASRTGAGERVTGETWLVRDKWQTTNVRRRGGNYGLGTIPKQLKANGLKSDIDDALWRVGIRVTSAKHHEFKECHGFRKFFKTYAQRTMKETNVERLLGHAGHWSDAAYNRPPDDWLIDEYLKAVPDLTIYKPVDEQTQILSAQMESKDNDIHELKERMDKMGNVIMHLDSNVKFYKNQFLAYFKQFGARHLTEEERERIDEFQELLRRAPDNDDNSD